MIRNKRLRRATGAVLVVAGAVLIWLVADLRLGAVLMVAGVVLEIAGITLEHRDDSGKG